MLTWFCCLHAQVPRYCFDASSMNLLCAYVLSYASANCMLAYMLLHRGICTFGALFTYARSAPNLLLGAWLTHCGTMAEVAILFEVLLGKRSLSCTRVMCVCVCRLPACRLQITSLVTFLLYFQDCTAKNRCSVAIL